MKLPLEIEEIILSELNLTGIDKNMKLYFEKISLLRKGMAELSHNFAQFHTTESRYQDAYFAYNFAQNFMKTFFITKRLFNFYRIPYPQKEIKILDLGCGDGAGMYGLYYGVNRLYPDLQFCILGVERENKAIERCKRIGEWLKKLNHNIGNRFFKNSAIDFIKEHNDKYEFIIIANLLVEIFPDSIPLSFVKMAFKLLKENGVIIIIEPALKKISRRLMELHNRIKESNVCNILLPCFHNNNSCPALLKKNEWCHHSIEWSPPHYLNIINRTLYRKIEYLKFSFLVLSRQKMEHIYDDSYLVISRLSKEKGRKRCFICSENGMVEIVKLSKNTNSLNQEFDKIVMNDIIQITNGIMVNPLNWKIGKQTQIKRLDF